MHPLAHMLTGAVIGQAAPSTVGAAAGGLISHLVLDAIPHAEGETFKEKYPLAETVGFFLAGVEAVAAVGLIGWMISTCGGAKPLSVGVGVLAAIVPDLIDLPLKWLTGLTLLHTRGWHRTVKLRHALWGILTQVGVIGAAIAYLWRATGCGP